ncbi:MAG: hypothetical protein HOQ14_06880 [Gemmatimonadaceae bacterium]|nr:hypothetical protein [Gemmatimonadaceae bacterium]
MIILYGVAANACYTFGFASRRCCSASGATTSPVGPTLWRHGLVFSVGLTLFPIGAAWLAYLFNAVHWLLFA